MPTKRRSLLLSELYVELAKLLNELRGDRIILDEIMYRRNKILSYPMRKTWPHLSKYMGEDSSAVETLSAMALMGYTAIPNFVGNVMLPVNMIMMGVKPYPVFEGITYVRHSPYVKPLFQYLFPATPAYKAGAKLGGKIGGKIGARLIPGAGWAMLAYDAYDLTVNRSLWGFDLD
jgi:hypothetical protein